MGKTFICIISGLFVVAIFFVIFLYSTDWLWPEFNGSYDLGKNIYMIDWDGGGKVIVKGTSISGKTCYGGTCLIPTYENQYDSLGNLTEYVIEAKSDNNWITARTKIRGSGRSKFYILDKRRITELTDEDEIIDKYTTVYTDSMTFIKACNKKHLAR